MSDLLISHSENTLSMYRFQTVGFETLLLREFVVRPVVADVAFSFVSDINIPQVTLASDSNQVEEYESDWEGSDIDMDGDSEDLVISKPVLTRSGRQVKV